MAHQSSTQIALSGQIQLNRGSHPFVVVTEAEDALRALEAVDGSGRGMVGGLSASGPRRFHEPVTVLVGGVEHLATGIGAYVYDEETTRERNPRNGKIKSTTTRVEGSGRRYVYLQEQAAPVTASATVGTDPLSDLDEDERAAWADFHSPAREARREDF